MIPNLHKKSSGWYECACPFCGDTKAHMQISPDFSWGRCFRCNASVPIAKIMEAYNTTLENSIPKETTSRKKRVVNLTLLSMDFIPIQEVDIAMDYLYSRGVLVEALLNKWQFGMHGVFQDRIIIPVYCGLQLKGYVGRTINPEEKKRYLNSTGFDGANTLFNYDAVRGKKIITLHEGIFDVMQVQKALPMVGALGCFGKELSEGKVDLLRKLYPEEIVIMLDSEEKDKDIKASIVKMRVALLNAGCTVSIARIKHGDPADNTYEEIQEAFYERQIY